MSYLPIMEYRHDCLQWAYDALQAVHVPLVQKTGETFGPAAVGDDKGACYFIPLLAQAWGIPLESAINGFFVFFLYGALAMAFLGFCLLFKTWQARVWALTALIFFKINNQLWDVYLLGSFTVLALVPLFLLLEGRRGRAWGWVAGLVTAGLVCGYSDKIRSNSGTAVVLFILLFLGLSRILGTKRKWGYGILLLAFFLLPYWHFGKMEKQRDEFLAQKTGNSVEMNTGHSIWHPVYIGLGYLSNPYGIQYLDRFAYEKAESINPKVVHFSREYEQILKDQVFQIVKNDPGFVLKTMALKTLKLLYYALKFGNIGWLALLFWRPSWRVWVPFAVLGLFTALPSLLVVPNVSYASGFIAAAVVFGILSTGMAFEKGKS